MQLRALGQKHFFFFFCEVKGKIDGYLWERNLFSVALSWQWTLLPWLSKEIQVLMYFTPYLARNQLPAHLTKGN